MKTFLAIAILALLAFPAYAGEGECGGACPFGGSCAEGGCDVDGFTCRNACPLAKQMNTRRSLGGEAATASAIVRNDIATTVVANLQKI